MSRRVSSTPSSLFLFCLDFVQDFCLDILRKLRATLTKHYTLKVVQIAYKGYDFLGNATSLEIVINREDNIPSKVTIPRSGPAGECLKEDGSV